MQPFEIPIDVCANFNIQNKAPDNSIASYPVSVRVKRDVNTPTDQVCTTNQQCDPKVDVFPLKCVASETTLLKLYSSTSLLQFEKECKNFSFLTTSSPSWLYVEDSF